ncbi:unnamed protein product [Plasmodium vivax]|uniref:(malaria parasite P. vivax) hypothetical protein n=1 Tax=Plasmodium vivax TaxID=5855 RepID=A0A8S4H6L8_PLAVI|nr:unnamed protein product [Plasmodium vivax]
MDWLFRGSSRYINPYQKYDNGQCMNSYSTLKDDIYQKIDRFNNATHTDIYSEWHELYKYINAKNDSIKHCFDKRYINSDFSKDEKINKFRSICNKRGKCHINVESSIHKNPPSKRTGRVEPCRGKNCKTEIAGKVKLQPQLEGEPSKATLLQRPKAQETSREHAGGKESNKQKEVAQTDVKTLLNSIKSEDHGPESVTNKQSKDSPSQSNSVREFDAGGTLRVSNSGKSLLENNLSDNQTLDANQHNMQTHEGGDVENQDNNHQIVVTELPNRVSKLGRDSASEKLGDKGFVDKDNSIHGNNDVAHDLEDAIPLDNQKESVVSAPNEGVSSDDARHDRETYDGGVHGAANGREIEHSQEPGSEHLCNGPLCRAEKVNEMDTNDGNILGTLSEFFNAIQDNPQIIKTSAPIGIALLLGLLFKYTPLWRVLTKKNRKKGAGINEELNSVLQEPSIMDDERSIPFSYGAFEYSSFDQNSY